MRTILGIAGAIIGVLAGVLCVVAGFYMLAASLQPFDQRGLGIFAIGTGAAIVSMTLLAVRPSRFRHRSSSRQEDAARA